MALVKVTILAEDKTGAAVDRAKRKAQELEQAAQKVSSTMKTFGLIAAGAAAVALKSFADFDKGIREVGTLLSDVTEESLAQMGDEIKTLSVDFGQALDVMTRAKYDVVSAGFKDAADSALILETSAKLASGGVAQVSETADVLTTVLNAYGSSAAKVEDVSDKLFKTVELGKTRIDLLAGALGQVVAVAPTVGVGFDEVSAAMATLTAVGQSTDMAATALQATMTALLKPSDDMKKALKEIGFETGVAAVKTIGFTETVKALTEGANEAELAARFPNVRAMRAVFPLIGEAAGRFADNLEQIRDSAGATDTAFEKMAGSASFQLTQLKERGRIALIDLGAAVVPLLNALTSLVEGFTSMGGAAQAAVISLGGLILITAKLGPAILTLITGMSGATAATVGFGAALKALFVSNPIGLLITGLTLLVPAVIALDKAFGGAGNAMRDFRKEAAGMNLLDAQNSVESLNKELEETIKRRDMLLEKNAQEFVAKGQISIKGQEEVEAVNAKITELKNKIDIVSGQEIKIRASLNIGDDVGSVSSNVEIKANTNLDTIKNQLEESRIESSKLEKELANLQKRFDEFGGSYSARVFKIQEIDKVKQKLNEATVATEALQKQVEEIELAKLLKAGADAGVKVVEVIGSAKKEIETTPPFKIPFQIDSADLVKKYRDTLESLQKQSITLTAKANIELATKGTISEELQGEVGDVQKAISAVQKELDKLIPPMPKIDLGELQAVDLPTLAFEFDDASLKAAKAGVADVEAFRTQKAQEAQDFLNGLTLTADQMEIMRLQKQLADLGAFSDQRTELEEAVQERIAELREKAREDDFEANQNYLEEQFAQYDRFVNQISGLYEKFHNFRMASIDRELRSNLSSIDLWFKKNKEAIAKKYTVEGQITEEGKEKLVSLERAYQDKMFVEREKARRKEESALATQRFVKISQSISNTAVAVSRALASAPPPINYALASAVGAAGAVQTAIIMAQPYATGAILSQDRAMSPGEKIVEFMPVGSDKIPAMLSPGEAVISAAAVQQNRDIVERLIASGGSAISPGSATVPRLMQDGGFTSSATPISTGRVIVTEGANLAVNYNISPNIIITSNSLDPAASAQAINDFVRSDEFINVFRSIINSRELRLEYVWAGLSGKGAVFAP